MTGSATAVRMGERPDLWRWLGMAVAMPAMAAFLVAFYNFGYHNFTDFKPIESLEFAAIDSPGSMAQFFVSPCSDGESHFLFTVWVKEKAAVGP